MREKLIDDMAGVLGSLVGLANDVRVHFKNGMRKAARNCAVKSGLSTQKEIDELQQRIVDLEQRLATAEAKGKKK